MIKHATPQGNKEIKITLEEFIEQFNSNEAVLLDIRMPFEKKIWNIPFAIDMSADELENRFNELPTDKLIVVACPTQNRSPFAAMFLKNKGFRAKYLEGGLLNLMANLKGGEAKKLKV